MKVEESIADRKLELAHWLLELDDETVLQEIEELKKTAMGNWWNSLNEEDKAAVDRGMADIAAGKVSPQEEVMDRLRVWIRR
jgi:predicted transcriptional regulator